MTSRLFRPILFHGRTGWLWDLSASVKKVSSHACCLRLRGVHVGLAVNVRHDYSLPLSTTGSATSDDSVFGAQWTAWLFPCERFAETVACSHASLEAKVDGQSLLCTTLSFATFLRLGQTLRSSYVVLRNSCSCSSSCSSSSSSSNFRNSRFLEVRESK